MFFLDGVENCSTGVPGNSFLTLRRMFQDFANVRILRSYFAQPQTLAEFQVAQENWQHDLFQRAQQQAQKVRSDARQDDDLEDSDGKN